MVVLLREATCPWCGVVFWLCSACDRGHRYCSASCSQAARRCSQRRARRKYARSERGRSNNRERQRRFRQRHRGGRRKDSKKRNGSVFSSRARCALLAVCGKFPHPSQQPDTTPDPGVLRPCWKLRGRPSGVRRVPRRRGGVPETRATALSPTAAGVGCCRLCGRAGRVVRQHRRRGRFRWSGREPPGVGS